MSLEGLHEVAIATEKKSDGKCLCAALVNTMIKGYVTRYARAVQISMRARGSELLYGDADIQAAMKASDTEAGYALRAALEAPSALPDVMELSLRTKEQYCGRVRLTCTQKELPEGVHLDAALLVIGETQKEQLDKGLPELLADKQTAIVVAVLCDTLPNEADSAEEQAKQRYPRLQSLLNGRTCWFGWYSPYGFAADGKRREAGSAVPYGVEELFWHLMQYASRARVAYLQQIIQDCTQTIARRVSVFQADSVRRVMELECAREQYARAVSDIFAAKQLLALADGTPLAGERAPSATLPKE